MKIGGKKSKSAQCGNTNAPCLFKKSEIDEATYKSLIKNVKTPNIIANKTYIMRLTAKDDKFYAYPFATYMRVKEHYINEDNQQSSFLLEYYNGQKVVERQFSDSILNTKEIGALLNYGILFDETASKDLIKYLMISKAQAPIISVYGRLGWRITTSEKMFKGYKSITDNYEKANGKYTGSVDLTPKGDLKVWTAMVNEQISGNTSLEFALVLGFASPVLSLLNESYDIGSLVFNFSNTSSKGKTTAAMLAASVFSNPAMNKGTLITYNATENAIIETISSMNSLTVGLDEVGMSSVKNFSKLLYGICSGTSKKRLNGDATLKEDKQFSSVIISTAEYNILNENSPDGLIARVFEINDQLTTSAENSNAIKKVVMSNYALAGEKFIKFIIDNLDDDKSNLHDVYFEMEQWLSELTAEYKSDLRSRVISKLAVILVTADLLNEANILGFQLDMDTMADYLAEIVCACSSYITSDEKLLDIVAEEIAVNKHHFSCNEETQFSACWGSIVDKNSYVIVKMFQNKFDDLMLTKNIQNYTKSLKILKDKGCLLCECDRLTKRVTTKNGLKIPCYCFVIKKSALKKHQHN